LPKIIVAQHQADGDFALVDRVSVKLTFPLLAFPPDLTVGT